MRCPILIAVVMLLAGCKYLPPMRFGPFTHYPEGYHEPEQVLKRQQEEFYRATPNKDGPAGVDFHYREPASSQAPELKF